MKMIFFILRGVIAYLILAVSVLVLIVETAKWARGIAVDPNTIQVYAAIAVLALIWGVTNKKPENTSIAIDIRNKRWLLPVASLLVVVTLGIGALAYAINSNVQPAKGPTASVDTGSVAQAHETQEVQIELSGDAIAQLINDYRKQHELPSLVAVPELYQSALDKCTDMQKGDYFDHKDPITGRSGLYYAQTEFPNAGKWGENLAAINSVDNADPVEKWLNSRSHRDNILDEAYRFTGVAICAEDPSWTRPGDTKFIVQHFAG